MARVLTGYLSSLAALSVGVFTATEVGAIAVLYSLFLAVVVYREVKLRGLPDILLKAGGALRS